MTAFKSNMQERGVTAGSDPTRRTLRRVRDRLRRSLPAVPQVNLEGDSDANYSSR
jgi:hypothetical protein